ncbi:MAG: hypothetical protein WCL44_02165 [bacterium]
MKRSLVFTIVGQPDKNLLNTVSSYAGLNCECTVRTCQQPKQQGSTPEEEADQLQRTLGSNDVLLVALLNVPEDITFRSYVSSSRRVAILNIWALRPKVKLAGRTANEQYVGRVVKEAMCALGSLLGLDTCPDPRCAMSSWDSETRLDAKGGNFCPPCLKKAQKQLERAGVTML